MQLVEAVLVSKPIQPFIPSFIQQRFMEWLCARHWGQSNDSDSQIPSWSFHSGAHLSAKLADFYGLVNFVTMVQMKELKNFSNCQSNQEPILFGVDA